MFFAGFVWWRLQPKEEEMSRTQSVEGNAKRASSRRLESGSELFGERILRGYGSGPAERDIELMDRLLKSYRLLAKNVDSRHYSSNEGIAKMLRGEGIVGLQAVGKDCVIFNDAGLLVDRWGNPYFFHPVSSRDLDIYLPGKDGVYATGDDLSLVSGRVVVGSINL